MPATNTKGFDRKKLRGILKWALRPEAHRRQTSRGVTAAWFDRKVNGLLAYSTADKDALPQRAIECVRAHYCKGMPIHVLAVRYGISHRQVIRDLNRVLDAIMDSAPLSIIVALCPPEFAWKLGGCTNCTGDMWWDEQGAHGGDGEWVCFLCGRRYDVDGKLV